MEGKPQSLLGKLEKDLENATKALEELQQDNKDKICIVFEKTSELYKINEARQATTWVKNIVLWNKVVGVLAEFMENIREENLNQNLKENLSTVWKVTWENYKNMKVRCMEVWSRGRYFWEETVDFLEKFIFLKEYLRQNEEEKLCTWKGEICEIYKNVEARRVELWKQITDLLEKTEVILEEGLNRNDKEKASALLIEIWETHKNVEARSIDFGKQNTDLWMKIRQELENLTKMIQEGLGLRRDAPLLQEEEKE